jgi:hypothetical protein
VKLRILDDSIRLRLARAEVDLLAAVGEVSGTTRFPGGAELTYRLASGDTFTADSADGVVTILIPAVDVAAWTSDDEQIGLYANLPTAGGELRIIVEKDFHCLIPRPGIDPADFFPNPKTPRVLPES